MAVSPKKARRFLIAALSSLFSVPLIVVGCFLIYMVHFGHAMSGAGAGTDAAVADAEFWRGVWFAALLIAGGLALAAVAVWGWLTTRCS